MVNVVVALVATLAAFGCAGLLGMRAFPERRIHLFLWTFTLAVLGLALGAMTIGYAAGFSPALLRCVTLFGALLAPFSLALGVVELVARTVQARFAARLIAGSYVVVAVVIILLDPIIGTFGKSLPEAAGHYSSLPKLVVNGAHVFAVVALVSCVAVTAMRGNKRDKQATEIMLTVAMVAFAGVLLVTATRGFLPGPLAPLALGGAVALTWFGVSRVLPKQAGDDEDDEEAEPYDEMSNYAGQPPLGRPSGPPPQAPSAPGHQTGGQYPAQPSFAPQAAVSGPVPFPIGQYGRITMYTLHDGRQEAFDRLAAEVTRAVIEREPGTLVYACHSVDSAPLQRIFYQLFRDAAAVENHTRQPHVQRFAGEVRAHVASTNVIELTATAAKVAPPADVQRPQEPQRPSYDQPRPQDPHRPAYDAQRPQEPQRPAYDAQRPQEPQRPAYEPQRPQEPQRAPYDPSRQPAGHRPNDMTGPRPVQRPAQDPNRPPHNVTGPRPIQQPPNGRPPHQPNPPGRWPHG
ncbi:antibiotic biosynthesis monooxygenase [Actinoallomurus spadix]|uniref:ABM domain-containing protein n=1 Tax=Actinoallomurus spadix TaxID=79912 RepID=A0ABP3G5W3_9ACTN|nr:antibiotic biosynthesis monooxygenase [Actinoallomurus spadix]MCO5987202.1 antibiotic biosynthesis monooxygenase [Actinoallomurus spadix]